MPRTPFATELHDTPQKSARVPNQNPSYIIIHHAATESFDGVVALEMGAREVSSTVIVKDDRVASMMDESYRAWSVSSQEWDSMSLSVETCNSGGAAQGWPISDASYNTLAKIVADWCKRYSIPCNRERVIGHGELYSRYGASYATACPGGIDLDRLVAMSNAILNGSNQIGRSTMPIYVPLVDFNLKPAGGKLIGETGKTATYPENSPIGALVRSAFTGKVLIGVQADDVAKEVAKVAPDVKVDQASIDKTVAASVSAAFAAAKFPTPAEIAAAVNADAAKRLSA